MIIFFGQTAIAHMGNIAILFLIIWTSFVLYFFLVLFFVTWLI